MPRRLLAILALALAFVALSPSPALACGVTYESGGENAGCGGSAPIIGAVAVGGAAVVTALVLAVLNYLRGAMSPDELAAFFAAQLPGTSPPGAPDLAAQRIRNLGMDPATGRYRPAEAETAQRVEQALGVTLKRATDPGVDWVDNSGRTYDAVGNFDARHFEAQWPNLKTRILDHLAKADFVPIDVSKFTPEQVARMTQFIADNGLGPRAFLVGR